MPSGFCGINGYVHRDIQIVQVIRMETLLPAGCISRRTTSNRVALVTGGAGFLGSHVAEYLLASGSEVVVLDDLSGGYQENVPYGARLVIGSILDRDLLRQLFGDYNFTHIYHFAAYAAECLSHHIRNFNYMNNVVGTSNLITEAVQKAVSVFVFASSAGVYGPREGLLREDTVPQPEDPYGIAKYAMELDLQAAFRLFGLRYVIFRLHNVYGEKQDLADRYRNVVGIYMRQGLRGQPMTVFGDGLQTRNFSYVRDVVPHIVKSVDIESALGQVINLGGEQAFTVLELSKMVADAIGVKWEVQHEPQRLEVRKLILDHTRARRIFGFTSETPLQLGLECMAQWAKNHMREPRPFRLVELDVNLPPAWRAKAV
jgi:UDP-glucose 4-epimerase